MYFDQIETCTRLGINYSEMMPEGYYYLDPSYGESVANAIAGTNGINITYGDTSQLEVYQHIVACAAPPQMEFDAIVPTGWKHIVLDGILDPDNDVNSDTDSLTDWEEVDTDRISWDTDGSVILPTIQDCIGFVEKGYAEEGLTRYKQEHPVIGMPLTSYVEYVLGEIKILPIYSDPTEEDSDGDGLYDINDPTPLSIRNYDLYYIVMDDEATVTLLQQCLVYLGYLDMEGNSYGTFGGLTSAAVQLYQVNHRSYEKNKSLRIDNIKYDRRYLLDRISYYSIICEAVNCGFSVSDENEYFAQSVEEAFSFFKREFTPKSTPLETKNVSNNVFNPVYIESVVKEGSSGKSIIYVYDLTIPLEGMLRRGAQEFHFYHYQCNAQNSWVDDNNSKCVTYDNSSEKCRMICRDYIWLCLQVANGNRYDVKVENSWSNFFKDLNLEVPYYHSAFPFVFNGEMINAEQFGNILYGFAGNAGGYSCDELVGGGSVYSWLTTGEPDKKEDSDRVKEGYSLYEKFKRDYYYLHITW